MNGEEWDYLPYRTDKRLPLTGAIPQFFRWKIANLKLFLADIATLEDKYKIEEAGVLYAVVRKEAANECLRIAKQIMKMQDMEGLKERWMKGIERKLQNSL